MMVSFACKESIYAEDGRLLLNLLNPTVGWARHIPLPTLVAYREKVSRATGEHCFCGVTKFLQVFPRDMHHLLPLERPECWVTCDSIGLFLETECQFPLDSEDSCDYHHESTPSHPRKEVGLTKSFVKKSSLELVEHYRCFVSPVFLQPPWIPEFVVASSQVRSKKYATEHPLEIRIFPSGWGCL